MYLEVPSRDCLVGAGAAAVGDDPGVVVTTAAAAAAADRDVVRDWDLPGDHPASRPNKKGESKRAS